MAKKKSDDKKETCEMGCQTTDRQDQQTQTDMTGIDAATNIQITSKGSAEKTMAPKNTWVARGGTGIRNTPMKRSDVTQTKKIRVREKEIQTDDINVTELIRLELEKVTKEIKILEIDLENRKPIREQTTDEQEENKRQPIIVKIELEKLGKEIEDRLNIKKGPRVKREKKSTKGKEYKLNYKGNRKGKDSNNNKIEGKEQTETINIKIEGKKNQKRRIDENKDGINKEKSRKRRLIKERVVTGDQRIDNGVEFAEWKMKRIETDRERVNKRRKMKSWSQIFRYGSVNDWESEESEKEEKRTWKNERKGALRRRKEKEWELFGGNISEDDYIVGVQKEMIENNNPLGLKY